MCGVDVYYPCNTSLLSYSVFLIRVDVYFMPHILDPIYTGGILGLSTYLSSLIAQTLNGNFTSYNVLNVCIYVQIGETLIKLCCYIIWYNSLTFAPSLGEIPLS